MPGSTRPARPRRWSAAARDTRTVSRRVRPTVRLIARHPGQAAIDHHPHAVDGDRGLGNRGRQHDLAPARRRRRDGAVLRLGIERTVKRKNVDRRIGDAFAQSAFGAADFAGARQEGEDRSGFGAQRPQHRVGNLGLDRLRRIAADIAGLDRKSLAFARDHRGVAKRLGDAGAVDRRRHDQQPQILAQPLLGVARQREAEIGIERALVELVEQHGARRLPGRIVENEARENALGHHLDAGAARHLRAEPDPVTDGVADLLRRACLPCARRRRARRGGAAPAPEFSGRPPRVRREARAAPAWSCRRRAAPPARRRCGAPARPRDRAAPHRSATAADGGRRRTVNHSNVRCEGLTTGNDFVSHDGEASRTAAVQRSLHGCRAQSPHRSCTIACMPDGARGNRPETGHR